MHVILDARKLTEKEKAHEYLQKVCSFPAYYGRNLDALYDCLSEISDLHIHLLHTKEADGYFGKILSVLEDLEGAQIRKL